MQYSYILQPSN